MGSPQKSSVFSSSYFGSYESMPLDDVSLQQQLGTRPPLKPITPRPSEPVCVTGRTHSQPSGNIVYAYPQVRVGAVWTGGLILVG